MLTVWLFPYYSDLLFDFGNTSWVQWWNIKNREDVFILAMHAHHQWPIKTPHSYIVCVALITLNLLDFWFGSSFHTLELDNTALPFNLGVHTRLPSQGGINSWSRILLRDLPSSVSWLILKILFTSKLMESLKCFLLVLWTRLVDFTWLTLHFEN